MSLVLYYSPGACSGVTINAIEELGLKCDYQKIDIASGEQKQPAYQAINPFGKVPALVTDGQLLTENPAILIYLNSLVPGSLLFPKVDNDYQRALYYSDLMWLSSSVHPSVRHVCMPVYYTISQDTADVTERGRQQLHVYFDIAEKRLANQNWWYGNDWAIVDTYLHWCYSRAQRGGYSLDNYPALLAHKERVETRPSFKSRQAIEHER